jgi:hypothetical protein
MPLASSQAVGTPAVNFAIFAFFVLITLVIAVSAAGKNKSASDYYTGGRTFTSWQNGIAIGGDYLSAASFLGIAGIIALAGYDGFLYSIGFLVGWLLVLLLVSEPLRNTGRYTMADVIDLRLRARPVRAAAARQCTNLTRGEWSTSTGSAWISFFMWMKPHLLAGAAQAAAQDAVARDAAARDAVAEREAAEREAARVAALSRGRGRVVGDVNIERVASLLDEDDEEDAGYGQIMVHMTRNPLSPRKQD